MAFHRDSLGFPTVASTVKIHGRPSFSVDKGPRIARSPPLSEEEETEGIFVLLIILRTLHQQTPVDQWTINMQVYFFFFFFLLINVDGYSCVWWLTGPMALQPNQHI